MNIPFFGHKEEFKPPKPVVGDSTPPTFADPTVADQLQRDAAAKASLETLETQPPVAPIESAPVSASIGGAAVAGAEQTPQVDVSASAQDSAVLPTLEQATTPEDSNLPPVA